jgi:Uma2 family endonuclease
LENDLQFPAIAGAEYDALKRKLPMRIEATKKLFTVEEFYGMAEAGILRYGERVELIDGEIFQMSAIGNRHLGCVNRANRLFVAAFTGRAVVSIHHPVQLTGNTEPQPDVTLLKFRQDDYSGKKPFAEDVVLLVEVSNTTLRYDRNVKVPRYAKAGIPEVWIENLEGNELLVYRNPLGNTYQTLLTLHRGDSISVLAFPDAVFTVDELLG